MNYNPFKLTQKQNQQAQVKSPLRTPNRKDPVSPYTRPFDQRFIPSDISNILKNKDSNHTKSIMTYEYENEDRHSDQYLQTSFYTKEDNVFPKDKPLFHDNWQRLSQNRLPFDEKRNFNAKHMEIQSKLNKIQSYHHKIQTLLEAVNPKPKTPNKYHQKQQGIISSKSVSKISTPLSINLQSKSKQRQRVGSGQFQKSFQRKRLSPFYDQRNTNIKAFQVSYQERFKVQDFQKGRKNKYLRSELSAQFLNSQDRPTEDSNRKKSKEYMKSIQGEVKEIQSTIELLNQKIKQNERVTFRKQINFDDLSTSNPQSESKQTLSNDLIKNHAQKTYSKYGYSIQSRYGNNTSVNISERLNARNQRVKQLFKGEVNAYQASGQTSEERNVSKYNEYKMRRQIQRTSTHEGGFHQKLDRNYMLRDNIEAGSKDNSFIKRSGQIYKQEK